MGEDRGGKKFDGAGAGLGMQLAGQFADRLEGIFGIGEAR